MNILRNILAHIAYATGILVFSCASAPSDDAIPYQPFPAMVIQLSNPEFQDLHIKGYFEINDIGVKGVILHKVNASSYHAYERNCSFEPNTACALVQVDPSGLYMFDSCCGSRFDMATGSPSMGPAWRNLRRYVTSLNGSQLTITDEVIE